MTSQYYDLITVLGPTASGKTTLAVALAEAFKGEIISADSRQVYKGMDIGTGKDLNEYRIGNKTVNYHLIDTQEAGSQYNVFQYQRDFLNVYNDLLARGVTPVLCGGSGLYVEAILRGYHLMPVPKNKELRQSLAGKSLAELTERLSMYKQLHNTTIDTVKRAIRAIEIAEHYHTSDSEVKFPAINSLTIGIRVDREVRRQRITARLKQRLEDGLVAEVEGLLASGITAEDLIYYGLEYKYVTFYLTGKLSYAEMVALLEIAIHQFAKRQMTWFRGMERKEVRIHWIDEALPLKEKVERVMELYRLQK